jgi:hypothetical protein
VAAFGGVVTKAEMAAAIAGIWTLAEASGPPRFFA